MIMTKKVILSILGENYSQRKSMNINKLNKFRVPGIAIAEYVSKIHFVITDKAKPRAIVGRKATGPSGIAGLPKQAKRTGLPWLIVSVVRFLFLGSYWMSHKNSKAKSSREGGKAMRIKKIKVVLLVIVAVALTVLAVHYETIQSNALVLGSRSYDVVRTVIK